MRLYNFRGQGLIVTYRYINNGLEVSTVFNSNVFTVLYNEPKLLMGYSEITDLIDDLSYDFIKRLGKDNNE
jgi:hypothetical protein